MRFPDFGQELRRLFEVDQRCFDCAELYAGCQAMREDPDARCRDYLRLPDVKLGTTGQDFPPSRMQGRTEPRIRSPVAKPSAAPAPAMSVKARECKCGRPLEPRRRICDFCRSQHRAKSQRKYQMAQKASKTAQDVAPAIQE